MEEREKIPSVALTPQQREHAAMADDRFRDFVGRIVADTEHGAIASYVIAAVRVTEDNRPLLFADVLFDGGLSGLLVQGLLANALREAGPDTVNLERPRAPKDPA
jgi:hypothetical protein